MLKAILWDFGNVLVRFDNRNAVCRKIARNFGYSDLSDLFPGTGEGAFEALDTGAISHTELWERICAAGMIDPKRLTLPMFSALYVTHLKPIEENVAFARELQERFRMFGVSNGDFGSEFVANMLACDHGIHFERVFVSHQLQQKKPLMLERVAQALWNEHGLRPAECLFVDDVPEYVAAARSLGMQGLNYNAGHAVPDLRSLLQSCLERS